MLNLLSGGIVKVMKNIQAKDVKTILSGIVRGTILTVRQIQGLIASRLKLSAVDWEPYTNSRRTNYPKWHAVIQRVLFEYKQSGKVIHVSEATYMFN